MPGINRANHINSPLQERVGNETPTHSPDASADSRPSGRRERQSVLGLLTRRFRRTNSPPRAQGGEPPPRSEVAPQAAAPVLRRSSALTRDRAEGLMAQGESSRAAAQRRTAGDSSPGPSTPGVAPRLGAARRAPAPGVDGIIEQFRHAGVDLAHARRTLSNIMAGNATHFDRSTMSVLQQHFPHVMMNGVSEGDPLGVALLQALGRFAPSLSRATPVPSRARAQPSVTGGLSRRPPTPPRGTGTNAPLRQQPAHRANARPSGALAARAAASGIDMRRLRNALDNTFAYAADLPADIRQALNRAGIDTHIEEGITLVDHPLLRLRQEIGRAESIRNSAGSATPPRDVQRAARTRQTAARGALVMPERSPRENNGQYAWRVHTQNPGVSVEDIASAAVPHGGDRQATVDALNGHINTYEKICTAFSMLRQIPKADAERMGFKDAAIYNQEGDGEFSKDLATNCLFGEELSLSNPNQRVIGLAQIESSSWQGYQADVNKDVVFMDMKKLAEYLVSNPKHPMNNMSLTADNIRNFAFKIS